MVVDKFVPKNQHIYAHDVYFWKQGFTLTPRKYTTSQFPLFISHCVRGNTQKHINNWILMWTHQPYAIIWHNVIWANGQATITTIFFLIGGTCSMDEAFDLMMRLIPSQKFQDERSAAIVYIVNFCAPVFYCYFAASQGRPESVQQQHLPPQWCTCWTLCLFYAKCQCELFSPFRWQKWKLNFIQTSNTSHLMNGMRSIT